MTSERKGIILAGGKGTRLYPLSKAISKQLMPVYDKPMVYYPLSTLMLAGITEILIITNPSDLESFKNLIGDGSQLGLKIKYKIQKNPDGLVQAFLIGEEFIKDSPVALTLGDNLFHGNELLDQLRFANSQKNGATIFAYRVNNPSSYGVVDFDNNGKVLDIQEKPDNPSTNYAVTGLYFYDNTVISRAKLVKPSIRNELEITDLNKSYLETDNLNVQLLGRGLAWLDTGSFKSLNSASIYIRTIQNRQGMKICCPEEIAWRLKLITDNQLMNLAKPLLKSGYGKYLLKILEESESEHFQLERNLKRSTYKH